MRNITKMKSRAFILFALLAVATEVSARTYYVNQGVRYHIGDNRFATSTDKAFVGCYPVVGQQWIQAFRVNTQDRVRVRIENIWAVDDCSYCKDLVWIDDALVGRIYAKDNGHGFTSLEPLDFELDPNKVHYLKIESVGLQADDFVISNVVVESSKADITMMEPGPILKNAGDPMPQVYMPRRAEGACDGLPPNRDWMLGWNNGAPKPLSISAAAPFAASPSLCLLKAGQSLKLNVTVQGVGAKDAVSQPFECLLGSAPYSGWAMLFSQRRQIIEHGNLIQEGDYTADSFHVASFHAGEANELELQRCKDGSVRLSINGEELSQRIQSAEESLPVQFRSEGLELQVKSAE